MRAVTASRAALFNECVYAFRDGVAWDETTGRAAKQGDEFHQAIAPVVDPSIEPIEFPPTTKWFRTRFEHATAWVAANYVTGMRAEVAYAYDPHEDTARVLGYNIGREYDKAGKYRHEIAGSADIELVTAGEVTVDDWKTGRSVTDSVWPQLEWLGLFAARAHRKPVAHVSPLHVTDYGVLRAPPKTMACDGLGEVAEKIRTRLAMIDDAWPTPGAHCDALYCPARAGCDVYQAMKGAA